MLNKLQMQIKSYERRYDINHANIDVMDSEQLTAYLTELRRKYRKRVESENSADAAELQGQVPEINEAIASLSESEREEYEERAAIMEYDGGLPRAEAERRALEIVCGGNNGNNERYRI